MFISLDGSFAVPAARESVIFQKELSPIVHRGNPLTNHEADATSDLKQS